MISKFELSRKPFGQYLSLLGLVFLLTGCGAGVVQFAPTPLPPDRSPLTYTHPSDAFSITVPRDWSIFEQNLTTFASVAFAPPATSQSLLRIAVTRTQPIADVNDFITRYQTQIRPNRTRYTEQERQLMSDGSWRITGTLQDAIGTPRPINTFIQYNDTLFAVIDILIPDEDAMLIALERAVNTFSLGHGNFMADVESLTRSATNRLEVANVSFWSNSEGIFFITGEIANHGEIALNAIPIEAVLLAEDGSQVAGAITTTMGHALTPSGFAPFGLRFGQGQPLNARSFRLAVGGDDWQEDAPVNLITSPDVVWTDAVQLSQDGQFFVVGTVENRSQQTLREVLVTVTLLDASRRVIGTGFANVDVALLMPDNEANYVVLVPDVGGVASNYVVMVQALSCDDGGC